jgi:hypothetical protein
MAASESNVGTVDWRRLLSGVALASAAGEFVSAFFTEFPVAAIVFAALFVGAWLWLRRGGIRARCGGAKHCKLRRLAVRRARRRLNGAQSPG